MRRLRNRRVCALRDPRPVIWERLVETPQGRDGPFVSHHPANLRLGHRGGKVQPPRSAAQGAVLPEAPMNGCSGMRTTTRLPRAGRLSPTETEANRDGGQQRRRPAETEAVRSNSLALLRRAASHGIEPPTDWRLNVHGRKTSPNRCGPGQLPHETAGKNRTEEDAGGQTVGCQCVAPWPPYRIKRLKITTYRPSVGSCFE
jgi:hypothetical protein